VNAEDASGSRRVATPTRDRRAAAAEEGPGDPEPTWRLISAAARRAEEVGLDSVWLVDHLVWHVDPWNRDPGAFGEAARPGGYGVREAWAVLAAVAATTTRIRLVTLVTCTRYRNPALLANMAATVQEVSGGRLALGLGAGDYPREHERLGIASDHPIGHFEEALEIITTLLRTGSVDFEGQWHRARMDLPLRRAGTPPPPILVGSLGAGPRVLSLVARHADEWNGWIPDRSRADVVRSLRDAVDAACAAIGRDPATLRRSVAIAIAIGGPMTRREGVLTGDDDEIARVIAAFGHEGIDEVQVRLFPNDLDSIERLGAIAARLPPRSGEPRR
jgi:alkanesulfonate monooxygenase SsuD/methylene tetrahydromethanopterin reductase-like flavin-dependent oxidoreductase (luciferase family)